MNLFILLFYIFLQYHIFLYLYFWVNIFNVVNLKPILIICDCQWFFQEIQLVKLIISYFGQSEIQDYSNEWAMASWRNSGRLQEAVEIVTFLVPLDQIKSTSIYSPVLLHYVTFITTNIMRLFCQFMLCNPSTRASNLYLIPHPSIVH